MRNIHPFFVFTASCTDVSVTKYQTTTLTCYGTCRAYIRFLFVEIILCTILEKNFSWSQMISRSMKKAAPLTADIPRRPKKMHISGKPKPSFHRPTPSNFHCHEKNQRTRTSYPFPTGFCGRKMIPKQICFPRFLCIRISLSPYQ